MEETMKSHIAIRCAKAAILISSLKSTGNPWLKSTEDDKDEYEERETMMLKRAVEELKKELVRERVKSRKMRLCSVTESLLQITILLSLWSLFLMIFFTFL
ncbi:uncharacterized protein LOC132273323 [Cornus florida]|uniref:uncharacterized protein LOC132273323 n=1 Tax=Cornus florida TaxID=4283 RepID=UPI0028A2CA2F|nr:uncharacterized protein LOC132273323 [Cornus florida]